MGIDAANGVEGPAKGERRSKQVALMQVGKRLAHLGATAASNQRVLAFALKKGRCRLCFEGEASRALALAMVGVLWAARCGREELSCAIGLRPWWGMKSIGS